MIETSPHLALFERLVRLDRKGALELVEGYLRQNEDPVDLYFDVLEPALVHAGREWECGRLTVAHEHYLSETIRQILHPQAPTIGADVPEAPPVAVACCAPRERHEIGLMMVAAALRSMGVHVHLLGQDLTADAIVEFVVETNASLLCLSCTLDVHIPDLADVVAVARYARLVLTIAVGGAAIRGRTREFLTRIGADWTAPNVREMRRALPDWLRTPGCPPGADDRSEPLDPGAGDGALPGVTDA